MRNSNRLHGFALSAFASVIVVSTVLSSARAQSQDSEMAFMPGTETVVLLNDGGKYVAVDLKHIEKGGQCRMDLDSVIMKMGPGMTASTTRVRSVNPQLHSGGCPFLTEFEISNEKYAAARTAFEARKEAAEKRVSDIKKEIGDKWDELIGKK